MFKIYIVKYIINRQFYVQNLHSKKERFLRTIDLQTTDGRTDRHRVRQQ